MNKVDMLSRRDPEYFEIDGDKIVVIACDSCGGIGLKESDVLNAPNELVGSLTARVPVMELLSLGVEVNTISITITNESSPTADEIIDGVKSELSSLNLNYVISTEKNMKTNMTGVGITAIGTIEKRNLKLSSCDHKFVFIAGVPSVGDQVIANKDNIFNIEMIKILIEDEDIIEIIPCGSTGIAGELSKYMNCDINDYESFEMLNKSCGPSTAGLVLTKRDILYKYNFLKKLSYYMK